MRSGLTILNWKKQTNSRRTFVFERLHYGYGSFARSVFLPAVRKSRRLGALVVSTSNSVWMHSCFSV